MSAPATIPMIAPVVMEVVDERLLPGAAVLVEEAEVDAVELLSRDRVRPPDEKACDPPETREVAVVGSGI